MTIPRAIALTAACAAFLSACGGDDAKDTSSNASKPATLTQAEYVKQGNALCAAYDEKSKTIEASAEEDPAAAYKELGTEFSAMLDEMEALAPPADLAAQHKALMANGRATATQIGDLADATASGDAEKAEATGTALTEGSAEGDKIAGELGLTDCVGD
ncbi:MAG: hypothetical protein JHC95_15565 [Solirubrobacteraceae bacterium]|nr:hypothetical protein [Solirubrobacteraceae bacterium]